MTVGELKKLLSVMPDNEEVRLSILMSGEANYASLRAVTKWPCMVELAGNMDADEADIEEERKRHES